jgi:ubiquinone biosynthesis protein COQ9
MTDALTPDALTPDAHTPDAHTPDNRTLDELRLDLAPLIADAAVFDGWSDAALVLAAEQAGVDPDAARFAFKGAGGKPDAMAMITAWIGSIDRAMAAALPPEQVAAMPIRERIRSMVQFRLDHMAWQKEALRRARSEMAKPKNLAASARLGWSSADAMWHLAGDTATDYNHYTKRATLGAIYAATLMVFADDSSEDHTETKAFLDRRIEGIMRFEMAKARIMRPKDASFSPLRVLGRLRYPAR